MHQTKTLMKYIDEEEIEHDTAKSPITCVVIKTKTGKVSVYLENFRLIVICFFADS